MPRIIAIGALIIALALLVPAAVFAFSATQERAQTAPVSANQNDGSIEATDSDDGDDPKPWVGLYVMNVNERLADKLDIDAEEGVAVVKVAEDGPADDAGIERGDVIESIGGSDIETVTDVRGAVSDISVGDTLAFTVVRDGGESTHNVTVGERTAWEGKTGSMGESRVHGKSGVMVSAGIGAVVAPLNADLAEELEIETEEGVVILSVWDGSPADDAGLRKRDVIVSVDGETVDGITDVTEAVRGAEAGDTLTIVVHRENQVGSVTYLVTVEEGYGSRGMRLNLHGLGNLRGTLSGDEDGPVSITVSKVTVASIGDDSVTLTPTADGNDDITATVTDGSVVFKDGGKAEPGDLAVDDEGYAVVIDGNLKLLVIGTPDGTGRGKSSRFGRSGGGDDDDGRTFRHGGRGFGGGRDFLGPLSGSGGTIESPREETAA